MSRRRLDGAGPGAEAAASPAPERSVERLAAATLFPGFPGTEPPDWILRLAERGLGGVVLFARNVDGLPALAARLHEAAPVLVALDEEGQPTPVPPLAPETPDETRRAREAQLRRDTRLAERQRIEADRATPPGPSAPAADATR